jgi:hypothetical protein
VVLVFGHTLRTHEALVALMRCPASLRLSITSSRTVSSSAMSEVYGPSGMFRDVMLKLLLAETLPYAKLIAD